jgi:hypothetical protein
MTPLRKGIVLAVLQLAIVASLGAELLIDRGRYPRVWAQLAVYDPDLPIRGRYLQMRLEVNADRIYGQPATARPQLGNWYNEIHDVWLSVENNQLVANQNDRFSGMQVTRWWVGNRQVAVLTEPVAFFIPEDALDPSRVKPGEELWVEVTVPKRGPPRPIRLGIKKEGVLTPLKLN